MNEEINRLIFEREKHRQKKNFSRADTIRKELDSLGLNIEDTPHGPVVSKKPETYYFRSSEVLSNLEKDDRLKFSFSLVSNTSQKELSRLIDSIITCYYDTYHSSNGLEVLVVENNLDSKVRDYLLTLSKANPRVRIFLVGEKLGEAVARNITLRQSLGKYIVICDTSVEIAGDVFNPLMKVLSHKGIGLAGPFGLVSDDLHSFRESLEPRAGEIAEVDAQQLYFMACRRQILREIGFLNEKFKFYRHLDLDFSFSVKERGYKVIDLPLSVVKHTHSLWEGLTPEERDKKSRKNFYIFLNRWHNRADLLC